MIPASTAITTSVLPPVEAKAAAAKPSGWDLSFDNLLDIVNPLQHLPIIGTLYRAITHDQIAAPEKIAGGTLFGGLWGLISSVADTAFEAVTGKDFGSTVLALFIGDKEERPQTVASASSPVFGQPALRQDVDALTSALSGRGVDPATAERAMLAYSKSVSLAETGALR